MDITEIRRHNARLLASQFKTLSGFADAIGRSQTYVSRFMGKNPTKGIGNKIAREIESCFERPHGWLDQFRDSLEVESAEQSAQVLKMQANDKSGQSNTKQADKPEVTGSSAFTIMKSVIDLETKAAELLNNAQVQQILLEKIVTKEFQEYLNTNGAVFTPSIYRHSYDLKNHSEWERVSLHIPHGNSPLTVYQNDIEAVQPDAIIIAIPDALSTFFYAVPKSDYPELLEARQPLKGIKSLEFNVNKRTVNGINLHRWVISPVNADTSGWWF